MYVRLVTTVARAVSAFIRYSVSSLGYKRFLAETAGYIAFVEVVDFAAEHSKWVRDNKGAILTLSLLPGAFAIGGIRGKVAISSMLSRASLFSKIKLMSPASATSKYFSKMSFETMRNGVKISFNQGQDYLRVNVSKNGLEYAHSGSKAAAVLLAAGFGGAALKETLEDVDWESTGVQLSLALADIQHQVEEDKLKALFNSFDAVSLLEVGPEVLRSFLRDHPQFPSERGAALLQEAHIQVAEVEGPFNLTAWVDEDDSFIIQINNQQFSPDTEFAENQGALKRAKANGITSKALSTWQSELFEAFVAFFSNIADHSKIDLIPISDTSRSMATPLVFGNFAISMLWDDDSGEMVFVYSEDSIFGSAADGLMDEHEATVLEEIAGMANSFSEWVGLSDDDSAVQGTVVVSSGDLATEMGK
jgi:hypothetical protein